MEMRALSQSGGSALSQRSDSSIISKRYPTFASILSQPPEIVNAILLRFRSINVDVWVSQTLFSERTVKVELIEETFLVFEGKSE